MSASYILPDEPVPDFRARISRRGAARSIGAPRSRKLAAKRFAVLAAAIAVPALAAPSGLKGPAQTAQTAAIVQPMGFEIPGESFPGSAFYYLEDTPELIEMADTSLGLADDLSPQDPAPYAEVTYDAAFDIGPAARSLRMSGSASDHARAQQCLTQAIYYEAASESDSGQRAVAQVVLNRVAHPTYPNSVCGVVFQGSQRTTGCQFSFTCDGSLARSPSPLFWSRASRIARQALAGVVHSPVGLATHYHTLAVNPHWASSLDKVAVIGAHQFYRWRGKAGTMAAFTARYSGSEPMVSGRTGASELARLDVAAPDFAVPVGSAQGTPPAGVPTQLQGAANARLETAPAAETSAQASRLPTGGGVRSEYARSGMWRQNDGSQQ